MMDETAWLTVIFLLVALLYASVGQAGATGYLAAMGLFQLAPATMKTTALSLNLLVAAIGTFQFWRNGLLSWRTFYPFGVLGIPFSLIGGAVQIPRAFLLSCRRHYSSARCCPDDPFGAQQRL